MVRQIISARRLGEVMARLGLVPPETSEVELITRPTGPLQLRYTVFVTTAQLPLLAQAFAEIATEGEE